MCDRLANAKNLSIIPTNHSANPNLTLTHLVIRQVQVGQRRTVEDQLFDVWGHALVEVVVGDVQDTQTGVVLWWQRTSDR